MDVLANGEVDSVRSGSRRHRSAAYLLLLSCLLAALTGCGTLLAGGFADTGAAGAATVGPGHANVASTTRTNTTGSVPGAARSGVTARGCGTPPLVRPGTTGTLSLTSGGIHRTFRVHLPPSYAPRASVPLVVSFHGTGSNSVIQERMTSFSALADSHGFIVAYPQGTVGPNGKTGWSSGGPGHPTIGDARFVGSMLTYLQAHFCVNTRRIYATGFSNGGGMTALLACQMALRFAAFAAVSGSYYPYSGGCAPGRAVPILEIHGTGDSVVPYDGRPSTHLLPVMSWLQAWATRDGCASGPQAQWVNADVTRLVWSDCRGGVSVVHYRILGGAHAWPVAVGCGVAGVAQRIAPQGRVCEGDRSLPATSLIWAFLSQYSLPATPAAPSSTPAQHIALQPLPNSTLAGAAADSSRGTGERLLAAGTAGRAGLREEPAQQGGVLVDMVGIPDAMFLARVLSVAG